MKDYKNNNLPAVIPVMRSKNWIGIIKRIWTPAFPTTPAAITAKISFCITRSCQKKHSRYMRNNSQGEQYAIH